jgi:hypothetical protein
MATRTTIPEARVEMPLNVGENRSALWLGFPIALFVAVATTAGLFWRSAYSRETLIWATEGRGGDAATLFVIVPTLLISTILALRGSISARLVSMGTVLFMLYDYAMYSMAVHFNALFLVYCAALGFSFYALVLGFRSLQPSEIAKIYAPRAPVKTTATVLFVLAVFFAVQWLREIIPALLAGHPPKSVTDAGLLTSPVHVLDLSIVLPAFFITGIMLLRRKSEAFVLAPALIAFAILMIVAVAGMMAMLTVNGLATDYATAAILVGVATGLSFLLFRYLRV